MNGVHLTGLWPAWRCTHGDRRIRRDETKDRIRVIETCTVCGVYRHHSLAKRLADFPDEKGSLEAWGPVGVWTTNEIAIAGVGT